MLMPMKLNICLCLVEPWTILHDKIVSKRVTFKIYENILKIKIACTKNNFISTLQYKIVKIWAGHVAHMVEGRGLYRVLVGKPEGKRPLGRPRHRWKDNIKIDLHEMGSGVWTGFS
jgi:hypothetical protein